MTVFQARVLQNTYRGEYYDILLGIDDNTRIAVRDRRKAPQDEIVKIGYRPDGIIVY